MRSVHALVLVAALSLVAAACGDDSGTTTTVPAVTTTAGSAATTAPSGGSQEVTIIAEGGAFVPDEVTVAAGEIEVTFTDNDLGADEPHNIHFQIGDNHY